MMSSATPFCKGFLSFFLSTGPGLMMIDGKEDLFGLQQPCAFHCCWVDRMKSNRV